MTTHNIQHNEEEQRFSLATDGGEAVLQYRLLMNDNQQATGVNFTHTHVPAEMRGKGLAELLVRHGLKWAKQQGYEITASCWYVARFLAK